MNDIVKTCSVHGDLTLDQTRKDGLKLRCKACRIASNKKSYYNNQENRISSSMRWKQQNRVDYNEWCKQDRKNNPEKYRKYEENYKNKHDIEHVRKKEVARIYGLTVAEYELKLLEQNNLCIICKKSETWLGQDGKTVTPLAINHCHSCKEKGFHIIRGLLCKSCNMGLGRSQDNIVNTLY